MKSVFSLLCGILAMVALSLPWWDMDIRWEGRTIVSEISGWEALGETGLWWVGNIGPIITLVGGIVLIGCALAAFAIVKWYSEAENAIAVLRILPHLAGFLVVMGAVWYIFDARNTGVSGCGSILPFDVAGFGTWLAIGAGLGGLFVGVTVPSAAQMWRREYAQSVSKGSPTALGVRSHTYREDRLVDPAKAHGSAKEHFTRAGDYQSAGKHFQAIVEYDTAIMLDPNYTLAYFNRGAVLLLQGKKLDAITDFEKVLELSDDDDLIRMTQKRIEEASTSDIEEPEPATPTNSISQSEFDPGGVAKDHFNRACDYEARGDDARAITAYSQAIGAEPRYVMAYYNRGSLLLFQNKKAGAVVDFEKVLELSDDEHLTRMARSRIDDLDPQGLG